MALEKALYLKKTDYNTLHDTGTVTVNERTEAYNPDNLHLVPDETQEQIGDLQAEQAVQGAKIDEVQASVVSKYYRHIIDIGLPNHDVEGLTGYCFEYISSRSTAYTQNEGLGLLGESRTGIPCIQIYDGRPDGVYSGYYDEETLAFGTNVYAIAEETIVFNDTVTEL